MVYSWREAMRVFLFNSESGIYQGEDYVESSDADECEGMTTLPPPEKEPGQIPVYDLAAGRWELVLPESVRWQ